MAQASVPESSPLTYTTLPSFPTSQACRDLCAPVAHTLKDQLSPLGILMIKLLLSLGTTYPLYRPGCPPEGFLSVYSILPEIKIEPVGAPGTLFVLMWRTSSTSPLAK